MSDKIPEATPQDYRDIGDSVASLPKKIRVRILSGELPITDAGGQICVNMPLVELERLYEELTQRRKMRRGK